MVTILFLSFLFFPFTDDGSIQEVDQLHLEIYEVMENFPDSALALADESLELAKDIGYRWGTANAYYIKGYILDEVQNKAVAGLYMYMKAGHILEKESDSKAIKTYADLYINAGSILRVHGKHDEAIELYEKAIKKLNGSPQYQERKLFLLYNNAFAQLDNGNLQKSIDVISEAIDLSRILNNTKLLNYSYNLLGMILMKDNRSDQAIKTFNEVISNLPANSVSQANASNSLGDYFLKESQIDSALYYYNLAIDFEDDVSDPIIPFYTYCGLAKSYHDIGDYEEGIKYGNEALLLYDSIVPEDEHLEIFNTMSELYVDSGNIVEGNFYLKKYYTETQDFFHSQRQLINIKNEFQIDLLLAGFYSEIEMEEAGKGFQKWIVLGGSIFFGLILMLHFLYRKRVQTSFIHIKEIIKDYK